MALHPIYGERPPVGTPRFLRERRTGLGGSDAAAVLGVSPWGSALATWEVKRGLAPDTEGTERMVWGNRLEPAIRAGFNHDYDRHYRKPRAMLRHPAWPFIIGHVDGKEDGRTLEVKNVGYKTAAWGEPGTDAIPAHYFAQVQHYLLVTGDGVAEVAVLFGGNQMERYEVPAHGEFQMALVDDLAELWEKVRTGTPPEPDGSASAGATLRRMYPNAYDESIVATPEVAGYAAAYLAAKEKEELAAKEKNHAAQLMQSYMGERKKLVGPGFKATWSARAGSVRWQQVAEQLASETRAGMGDAEDWLAEYAQPFRGKPSKSFTVTSKEGANE